jgi:hypothetical protein
MASPFVSRLTRGVRRPEVSGGSVSVAKKIACADTWQAAWNLIRGETDKFIWTDDEEPEARWNEFAKRVGTASALSLQWTTDDRPDLHFEGNILRVPLVFDRDDRFIILHSIAQIGRSVLELRFCLASAHSSNQAYLACPPKEWNALEAQFGSSRLAKQFLRIPPDVKEFARNLYAPQPPPSWAI